MSRRNSVQEIDQGWGAIKDQVAKAKGSSVKVGILSDAQPHPDDGADMALIAAANEFGTSDGRIPPRPFIRGAFDANQRGLTQTASRLFGLIMEGKLTSRRALALMGEEHQGQVQEYLQALDTPPNAPRTVAQKGSSNPLVDEGHLLESIRWEHDR